VEKVARVAMKDTHRRIDRLTEELRAANERQLLLLGQLSADRIAQSEIRSVHDAEFRVFSQWGEDGILQLLLQRVPIARRVFVEIGVGYYEEANTRFLLLLGGWSGLVMDCHEDGIRSVRESELSWRYDLRARCAFVTRENVNELIAGAGIEGDIGLLSIDLDGIDYWIWKEIDVIHPRIVICEYNSLFGPDHAITVPYDPAFDRSRVHHSNLLFGASLAALCRLAAQKGYRFVGSNRAGVNAFFVREDVAGDLPALTSAEGFVLTCVRGSRDEEGRLTHTGGTDRLALIEHLEVVDVDTGKTLKLKELSIRYPSGG
jgi:hypothetical protein